MKVLLDTCVWGKAADSLRTRGHDVVWTGSWGADPGDKEILRLANDDGRVLVTLDKDFGQLVIALGHPHAGIVRLVGIRARDQGLVTAQILDRYREDLIAGAIVTVESGRVRVRGPS